MPRASAASAASAVARARAHVYATMRPRGATVARQTSRYTLYIRIASPPRPACLLGRSNAGTNASFVCVRVFAWSGASVSIAFAKRASTTAKANESSRFSSRVPYAAQ